MGVNKINCIKQMFCKELVRVNILVLYTNTNYVYIKDH